ncbi:MAG: hypothetical protein PVS2B2_17750 [Candidatus Acidiferrum sp.]
MHLSNVSLPSVMGGPDACGSYTQVSTPLSGRVRLGLLLYLRAVLTSAVYAA